MPMTVMIAQVPAVWNVATNLGTVTDVLAQAHPGDVVVLPEGMLSGYDEDLLLISPRGEVLAELPTGRDGTLRHTVDLDEAGSWYLGQRRHDVLSLKYHRQPG